MNPSARSLKLGVLCIASVLQLCVVLKSAWISDDAYITFRTVENALSGHGLTWNVAERVQSYTHPLWMLLLAAQTLINGNIYLSAILTSALLTTITVCLVLFGISRSFWGALGIAAALSASKAFVDYSTSGLENPLTHILVALFYVIYFRFPISRKSVFALYLVAGLAFLNRMDSLLVFLPVLARVFFRHSAGRSPGLVLWTVLPVIAWVLFSLFYYGIPVPNTAFAKLNTGIPATELALQSLRYFQNSLFLDRLTLALIAGAVLTQWMIRRKAGNPMIEGILLHMLYVMKIGGDFMSGRFLALPFLLACIYFARRGFPARLLNHISVFVMLGLGLATPLNPLVTGTTYGMERQYAGPAVYSLIDRWGISDERALYYRATGLFSLVRTGDYPEHYWYYSGLSDKMKGVKVAYEGITGVGFYGYAAGPDVFVVDRYALTDPLLARLPARKSDPDLAGVPELSHLRWRIGHFGRDVPRGYLRTLRGGKNVIEDPDIAEFYDKIVFVTRGPLLSWERLKLVAEMNLGRHDHLLKAHRVRSGEESLHPGKAPSVGRRD